QVTQQKEAQNLRTRKGGNISIDAHGCHRPSPRPVADFLGLEVSGPVVRPQQITLIRVPQTWIVQATSHAFSHIIWLILLVLGSRWKASKGAVVRQNPPFVAFFSMAQNQRLRGPEAAQCRPVWERYGPN